jgi:hypothetical protein
MPQFRVRMSESNCCRVLVRFIAQMDLSKSRNELSSNVRDMSLMDWAAPSIPVPINFAYKRVLETEHYCLDCGAAPIRSPDCNIS